MNWYAVIGICLLYVGGGSCGSEEDCKSDTFIVQEKTTACIECPIAPISRSIDWKVYSPIRRFDPMYVTRNGTLNSMYAECGRYNVSTSASGYRRLTISNIEIIDAGVYECLEDGKSYGNVTVRVAASIPPNTTISIVIGRNISIPCSTESINGTVVWLYTSIYSIDSTVIDTTDTIYLTPVTKSNIGRYTCVAVLGMRSIYYFAYVLDVATKLPTYVIGISYIAICAAMVLVMAFVLKYMRRRAIIKSRNSTTQRLVSIEMVPKCSIVPIPVDTDYPRSIIGVAVDANSIYLLRDLTVVETKQFIEVYDKSSYEFVRSIALPIAIASCNNGIALDITLNRLYVVNSAHDSVIIIELQDDSTTSRSVSEGPTGIHVHDKDHSIIVTCQRSETIDVYKYDGSRWEERRMIDTSVLPINSFIPRHTIVDTHGSYWSILTRRYGNSGELSMMTDDISCCVSFRKAIKNQTSRGLNNPAHMVCDDEFVYIADCGNNRIVRYKYYLGPFHVLPIDTLINPRCMYCDTVNRKLYIGELNGISNRGKRIGGRLWVYDIS